MGRKIRLTLLSKSAADDGRGKLQLQAGPGESKTIIVQGNDGPDYLCGKCGAVLLSRMPRLMFRNAALLCNECGRYSDASRPSKYAVPTMDADVDHLARPSETYPPAENGTRCPYDEKLAQLHQEFGEHWHAAQGDRPRRLYHYTTLKGLQGILATHQVWVTDVAYLNDSLEMQHGFAVIENALKEREQRASAIGKELLRRSALAGSPTSASMGYYVACFCEERDLLSQWRAYAPQGGGYAIGFSAFEMATEARPSLRRVIYDQVIQKDLVNATIDRITNVFEAIAVGKSIEELDRDRTLPAFAQLIASELSEYLITFKHDAFAEEREWRIILAWMRDDYLNFVKFRGDHGHAVPYMALHPRTVTADMPLLPIIEVVHGPTRQPELTRKSLHLMLQSTNYDHVEVGGSRAPLRV